MQNIRKRNKPFWINQAVDKNSSNNYREKLIMQGIDITIILILHINAKD